MYLSFLIVIRAYEMLQMNTTRIAVNGATAFLMIYLETKDRDNPKELWRMEQEDSVVMIMIAQNGHHHAVH